MSEVLLLAGTRPGSVTVCDSPLAELTAALHAYTEREHHPATVRWARGLDDDQPSDDRHSDDRHSAIGPELRRRIRAWSPLWASYRARYLLPMRAEAGRSLADELADIAALPLAQFAELTGYAVRGGNSGTPLDAVLHDPEQRAGLLAAAERRSTTRAELADRLLGSPDGVRSDLLDLLTDAATALEPDLATSSRLIAAPMQRLQTAMERTGVGEALAGLDPSASYRPDPPRVVFDKLRHGIVTVATTGCLVIPSVFGRPHLLFKHEPGFPPVIQYPLQPDGEERPGHAVVHRRLEALRDRGRQRIARAIAREPLTPTELASRTGMTVPQVSRHLARLRAADLVTVNREGRHAHYQLDLDKVRRIGDDLLTALIR